jgi:hypothetical protein
MNKEEELKTTFNNLKTALKENNIDALDNIVANDYIGFSLHGTIETKNDILNIFGVNGVVLSEYSVEDIVFEQIGDVGIVSGKGLIAGKFQEINFQHNVLFIDIFKFYDSTWKYYRSQVTEIKSA